MIRLFTSAFESSDESRREEYAEALRRNLECERIDAVCVFEEGTPALPHEHPKLFVKDCLRRPDYSDYFAWMNELAGPDDVSILANADIWFDSQLSLFDTWLPEPADALALARWEPDSTGRIGLRDRNDSQDAWIFRGRIREFDCDFPAGVPGCDNRLASELVRAGYRVLNPAFSIRSYHLHAGVRAPYVGELRAGGVPPPYGYVWPHNLWPLHRTLIHNIRHPNARVGWRLDKRLWKRRLKLHWFAKGLSLLSGSRPAARGR